MEYKKIRYQNSGAVRVLLILLAAIITVQCISIAVMLNYTIKYSKLYSEALEGQLIMQREINLLGGGEYSSPKEDETQENKPEENEER